MTRLLTALWADESGFIITAELVLIATIVVLGLIAALICVRDSVGGELNDIAAAFRNIDQSYYYGGMRGCKSWTAGSAFFQNRRRGPAIIEHDFICPPDAQVIEKVPCPTGDCPQEYIPCPTGDCPPEVTPCPHGVPCPLVVPPADGEIEPHPAHHDGVLKSEGKSKRVAPHRYEPATPPVPQPPIW